MPLNVSALASEINPAKPSAVAAKTHLLPLMLNPALRAEVTRATIGRLHPRRHGNPEKVQGVFDLRAGGGGQRQP